METGRLSEFFQRSGDPSRPESQSLHRHQHPRSLRIAWGWRLTTTIGSADRQTMLQSVFPLLHEAYTQHQHIRLRVEDPLPRC